MSSIRGTPSQRDFPRIVRFALHTIVAAGLLAEASCAGPATSGRNVLPVSPAVTKDRATHVALEELRRRKVTLPAGYSIKITEDYIVQEMAPAIPTYTVTFLAGRENLGHSINHLAVYDVAVSRNSGEFLFFSNLLKLKPAG
jgi:hypothetical protein